MPLIQPCECPRRVELCESHPAWATSVFQDSLSFMRPCLKNKQKTIQ